MTKKKGFTLVETMVVVLMISILSSISYVTYHGIKEKTYESTCEADRRLIENDYYKQRLDDYSFEVSITNLMTVFSTASKVVLTETEAEYEGICPAGGIIYIKTTDSGRTISVTCSKHSE